MFKPELHRNKKIFKCIIAVVDCALVPVFYAFFLLVAVVFVSSGIYLRILAPLGFPYIIVPFFEGAKLPFIKCISCGSLLLHRSGRGCAVSF